MNNRFNKLNINNTNNNNTNRDYVNNKQRGLEVGIGVGLAVPTGGWGVSGFRVEGSRHRVEGLRLFRLGV